MLSIPVRAAAAALAVLLIGCAGPKPRVVDVSPVENAVGVPAKPVITATFSEPVDAGMLTEEVFRLQRADGDTVPVQVRYRQQDRTALLTPRRPLREGVYIASLSPSPDGGPPLLQDGFRWRFAVGTATAHVSWDPSPDPNVNAPGGGYRVYYSRRADFEPGDSDVRELRVPYRGGRRTPTEVGIGLPSLGTYFFRVSAFIAGPTGEPLEGPLSVTRSASYP